MSHENYSEPLQPRTPYQEATHVTPDPRTEDEVRLDWVDPHLIDIYQQAGIIEAEDSAVYERDLVMEIARKAYLNGVKETVESPEAMSRFLGEDYHAEQRRFTKSQELPEKDDIDPTFASDASKGIADLPETPPDIPNN